MFYNRLEVLNMEEIKIIVLFTCYNRRDKTKNVIKKISNNKLDIEFLVVDDASTDGTFETLKNIKNSKIKILKGSGNLYYSGGMRMGMEYLINKQLKYDYLLMINDDVEFYDQFLEKMVLYAKNKKSVVIGATMDNNHKLSYGGVKYRNHFSAKTQILGPDYAGECDTFNGNCVLIPYEFFVNIGSMDKHYVHSAGDYDYGLQLKKRGYKLYMFNEYIGICNRNSIINTWQDSKLSIKERLRKKRDVKGLPLKQSFYFYYKNFNIIMATKCSIAPYIKILLKK